MKLHLIDLVILVIFIIGIVWFALKIEKQRFNFLFSGWQKHDLAGCGALVVCSQRIQFNPDGAFRRRFYKRNRRI